jgi:hypothetical protein
MHGFHIASHYVNRLNILSSLTRMASSTRMSCASTTSSTWPSLFVLILSHQSNRFGYFKIWLKTMLWGGSSFFRARFHQSHCSDRLCGPQICRWLGRARHRSSCHTRIHHLEPLGLVDPWILSDQPNESWTTCLARLGEHLR